MGKRSKKENDPNITMHHLIWTRNGWNRLPLRSLRQAKVRIARDLHERLHQECEPFATLSKESMMRLKRIVERRMASQRWLSGRVVLEVFRKSCGELLSEPGVPKADRLALACNIERAKIDELWLNRNVSGWVAATAPGKNPAAMDAVGKSVVAKGSDTD